MRRVVVSLVAAALVLAAFAMPAAAAKPEIVVTPVEEEFYDDELSEICGFDIWVSLVGHMKLRIWTDANGEPTREVFTISLRGEITAGGQTLRFANAGSDMVTYLDGGGVRVAIRGSLSLVTAPGHGPVLNAAGQFTFVETPVLDEEGNPVLDEDGNPIMSFEVIRDAGLRVQDLDAVCAALDPTP